LRELRKDLLAGGDALGCAIGPASATDFFVLALFRSPDAWKRFRSSDRVSAIVRRWPRRVWSMRWNPEHEFGHWDGLRMRRTKLEVPQA
jgi:hypothetical protein